MSKLGARFYVRYHLVLKVPSPFEGGRWVQQEEFWYLRPLSGRERQGPHSPSKDYFTGFGAVGWVRPFDYVNDAVQEMRYFYGLLPIPTGSVQVTGEVVEAKTYKVIHQHEFLSIPSAQ